MQKLFHVLLFLLIGFSASAYTGKIVSKINTPGNYPTGICFVENDLCVADRKDDKIYTINPKNGEILHEIPAPAYWPVGIAYDGEYLWCVDERGGVPLAENFSGVAYKLDKSDGTVLHQLYLPCSKPTGLTWDGNLLWVIDDATDMLIQIDPNDGTTIKSFKAPGYRPQGLTFDGTYLWVSDRAHNEIYMVSPETGKVLLITDTPGEHAKGMAWDGNYIWNADWQDKRLYKLVREDDELYQRYDECISRANYTFLATNFGPGKVKTIDIDIALGENRDNQELISDFKYEEKPTEIVTDKWGQKTAHWTKTNLDAGESFEVNVDVNVKTYKVRYFLFPDKVGQLKDIPIEISDRFLENNEKYQYDHPVIQNAVKEAVGEETNPYWIARKIYDYLMPNLYYEMSGGWNTAPTVLARGNGSCSEYSFVYIAMCRAAGLPARYVGSFVMIDDRTSMDNEFHRWVEVYLPNYGWIPLDPAGGDTDSPRGQAEKFAHCGSQYYITTQSGGGSETMGWTYNSNYKFTSEPKTHVVVEYFGDWEPLK